MQTRNRSRATPTISLPCIPSSVQQLILDKILSKYPEPDSVDYTLYPFKSTLGWLLSLRLVNQHWNQNVQQHPAVTRRCRLEKLRNLSLLHDYAHYIVTARASKKERIKAVPKKLTLSFCDGSISFAVPKGLTKEEKAGGLPNTTLMLVAYYDQFSIPSFIELLTDLDCLDKRHAAPMVIKVHTTGSTRNAAASILMGPSSSTPTVDMLSMQQPGSPTLSAACHASRAVAAVVPSAAGNVQQLIAAASQLLRDSLPHVVMEGTETSPALYFIPTKQGFCRRVKIEGVARLQ